MNTDLRQEQDCDKEAPSDKTAESCKASYYKPC